MLIAETAHRRKLLGAALLAGFLGFQLPGSERCSHLSIPSSPAPTLMTPSTTGATCVCGMACDPLVCSAGAAPAWTPELRITTPAMTNSGAFGYGLAVHPQLLVGPPTPPPKS